MPTADEVLEGLLTTSLKLDAEKVAAYKEPDGSWNDAALPDILNLTTAQLAAVRGDVDAKLSAKAAAVKRELMEEYERKVRDEFDMKDSNAKGIDLVKSIVDKKVNANGTITDDKVKAHPLFRTLEQQVATHPKAVEDKVKEREVALRSEFEAERDQELVLERARTIFKGMNPILPKNEEVARAQMTLLENYVREHKFNVTKDKGTVTDILPMEADGSKRLQDGFGHAKQFIDLVKDGARKYFEFHESEKKGGAPDPNKTGKDSNGSGDSGRAFNPKTTGEYAAEWQKIKDEVADHAERQAAWTELKKVGIANGVAS